MLFNDCTLLVARVHKLNSALLAHAFTRVVGSATGTQLPAELTWCSSYERNCSRSRLRRWMKRFGDTTPVRRFWLLICRVVSSAFSSQQGRWSLASGALCAA